MSTEPLEGSIHEKFNFPKFPLHLSFVKWCKGFLLSPTNLTGGSQNHGSKR